MTGEDIPRRLPERTGRHYCVSCLQETANEEYFRNDHICDACVVGVPESEEAEPAPKASAGAD